MDSPHAGEVVLSLGGKDCTIVYDWRALSVLSKEVGMDGLDLVGRDAETLAKVLAIGLRRHHPDITADAIADMSPPYMPVLTAVMRALAYAMHGPEVAEGNARAAVESPPLATGSQQP